MQATRKMEIKKAVKPFRMWIDGKCFNIFPRNKNKRTNVSASEPIETNGDNDKEIFNIIQQENGKYSSKFKLPTWYYKQLHNHRNFSIAKLAESTNTAINLPKSGSEGNLDISGDTIQNVIDARNEAQGAIMDIRSGARALQFIGIPLVSDEIKNNFVKFKEEILEGEPIQGLDASIFQSELKLHLTVVVFALLDDAEKEEAVKALNDYKTEVFEPLLKKVGPLKIKIGGLECMNDNYAKVNVLYANAKLVEENEELSLQNIFDDISNYFYDRGLVCRYQDSVKLHATLINTKYRKSSENSTPKKKRWHEKRITFDARPIMEKYKDYYFGEAVLDRVHLSLIGSKGEDGFYKPLAIIRVGKESN